jgi:hypothetical protein
MHGAKVKILLHVLATVCSHHQVVSILKDMYCKVIPVRAWVSEVTLSGIEHVTFQLVVQCLNPLHHSVPHLKTYTALLYSLSIVNGDMPNTSKTTMHSIILTLCENHTR